MSTDTDTARAELAEAERVAEAARQAYGAAHAAILNTDMSAPEWAAAGAALAEAEPALRLAEAERAAAAYRVAAAEARAALGTPAYAEAAAVSLAACAEAEAAAEAAAACRAQSDAPAGVNVAAYRPIGERRDAYRVTGPRAGTETPAGIGAAVLVTPSGARGGRAWVAWRADGRGRDIATGSLARCLAAAVRAAAPAPEALAEAVHA